MVSLDDAIIARYEHAGEKFEIFVDPIKSQDYKAGRITDLEQVLVAWEVFKDARKGDRPNEDSLKKAFGTSDIGHIASVILKKGDLSLTTEQKNKMASDKLKEIIGIIAREAIDPRTSAPHPPQRIQLALEQTKFHVDPFKRAEDQLEDVLKLLRPILPIKIQKVQIAVRVPAEFATKAYGILKENGLKKEEWQKDGSLIGIVEMPGGLQSQFYDRINKLTSGQVETKLLTT